MAKEKIPKALREQVWVKYVGKKYQRKCWIPWCKNTMNVFDFHVGHNLPESKGGKLEIGNLRPICARCNLSMSDTYTISEWMEFSGVPRCCGFRMFWRPPPSIPGTPAIKDSDTSSADDEMPKKTKSNATKKKTKKVIHKEKNNPTIKPAPTNTSSTSDDTDKSAPSENIRIHITR